MDDYTIIAPPFSLKFQEMSKQELKDYNEWFHAQIPERLLILERAVHGTPGFEKWEMDKTPESLDMLGKWFAMQVETRERTEEEMAEVRAQIIDRFKGILDIDTWELTNRTFSLAIDIGMYISQVFLQNIPTLRWEHITKGYKKAPEYGQPVLAGFGNLFFNPVWMMDTMAYGLAKGTRAETGLREIYEVWKKYVAE